MKHFYTSDCIYFNHYNDDLIVLNIVNDSYLILNKDYKKAFLDRDNPRAKTIYQELYKEFKVSGLLTHKFSNHQERRIDKILDDTPKEGIANIDWKLQYNPVVKKCKHRYFFDAYITLFKMHRLLEKKGLSGVLSNLYAHDLYYSEYRKPSNDELHNLALALNKASFYFSKSVRCLLWSATFVSLALKRKWQCRFVIGAQNYPFISHAWVETWHGVLEDNQNLPKKMAIIVKAPQL